MTIINAANEIAVDAFLNKKISFLNMFKVIEKSLEKSIFVSNPNLDDYSGEPTTPRAARGRHGNFKGLTSHGSQGILKQKVDLLL